MTWQRTLINVISPICFHLKETRSLYRIQIFWRKLIVLGLNSNRNLCWILNFEAAPMMSCYHHFLLS
jgi:hypothetical protein